MVENTKKEINYIESKKKNLVLPISFLLFVIFISVGLFTYNKYLQKQKVDFDAETFKVQQIIEELNNKPEIQVYSLLENNKGVIKELEKRSQVTTYLRHLNSLENNYWVKFEWFNLMEGKINSTAIIESTNEKPAYEKTRDFVRNYRTDTWALLDLEFINLIEWNDTMKFDVNFKIK